MRINALLGLALLCATALTAQSVDDTLATGRKALFNDGVTTAWRLAQKALAEAPASAAAHEFSGEVLFRRGNFADAENEFRAALKLDKNFALAWWGLGRVSDCMSLHKSAAQDFRQAHELNPRDPRIFAGWALRLRGRQHIDALEQYASMADPSRDLAELAALREHIQLDEALSGRDLMLLATKYEKTEIPLQALAINHERSYGLEIRVNGNPLKLVLDTGASGIFLSPKASQNAGIVRLAASTVRGFGNNTRPTGGYRGLAERVRIGDVEFRNALITVADQDLPDVQDGLIGTDVFEEFLVTLDFAARKLRLDPLPDYRPGDNDPHDRAIAPEMRNFTRVFRFGHMLLLPTRVSNSREVHFVLDTGAARTLISYDLAEEVSKLNVDGKTGLRGLSGKVADVYQTGDLFLQFAGFRQKNLGMTSIDLWDQSRRLGTEVSGFLGLPVLSLFTLTIDYRDGLVNFDRQQP
jgi:tetratricopeptide (TPR) repeat protein